MYDTLHQLYGRWALDHSADSVPKMCYLYRWTIVYPDSTSQPAQQIAYCRHAHNCQPCWNARIIPLQNEYFQPDMSPAPDIRVVEPSTGPSQGADVRVVQPNNGLAQQQQPVQKKKKKKGKWSSPHLEWEFHIPFTSKKKKQPTRSPVEIVQELVRPSTAQAAYGSFGASAYGQGPAPPYMQQHPLRQNPMAVDERIPVPPLAPQAPYAQPIYGGGPDPRRNPNIVEITPRNTPPASPHSAPHRYSRSHSGQNSGHSGRSGQSGQPGRHARVVEVHPESRRERRSRSNERRHRPDVVYRRHERRSPDRRPASPDHRRNRSRSRDRFERPQPQPRGSSRTRREAAYEAQQRAEAGARHTAELERLDTELERHLTDRQRAHRTQAAAEEIERLNQLVRYVDEQMRRERRLLQATRTVLHHDEDGEDGEGYGHRPWPNDGNDDDDDDGGTAGASFVRRDPGPRGGGGGGGASAWPYRPDSHDVQPRREHARRNPLNEGLLPRREHERRPQAQTPTRTASARLPGRSGGDVGRRRGEHVVYDDDWRAGLRGFFGGRSGSRRERRQG